MMVHQRTMITPFLNINWRRNDEKTLLNLACNYHIIYYLGHAKTQMQWNTQLPIDANLIMKMFC